MDVDPSEEVVVLPWVVPLFELQPAALALTSGATRIEAMKRRC